MSFRSAIIQKNFVFKDLEEKARKAKNEKKIFVILEGYEPLRQSLLARDWVEKIPDNQLSLISSTSEKFVMALLLKNCPFFFVWQPKSRPIKNGFNVYPCNSSVLRYSPYDFTSKEGLNNCAENHRWHHIDGLTDMNYQRAHVLSDKLSRDEFSEDYRNTAVTSFILFLDNAGADFSLFFSSEDNSVCTECITFAIQKVDFLISVEEHEDLDTNQAADYFGNFPFNQKESLVQIRQITNRTKKFKHESLSITEAWKMAISECAEKIKNQWPHLKYDGFRNVWIMKPLGASCGYGITVMNSERAILMESQLSQQRFLVQKYIEKPLLIHERKFDMRIYFMTFIREHCVDVWLYKDAYVKFGTNVFSLDSLHQSIHITNYMVQRHFMNSLDAVDNAKENMWTLGELLSYFESIGHGLVWSRQIYPGIKRILLAVVFQSLEVTELEPNNFELNGADFMIGYDFQPILIEINSKPALFFSRTVVEIITKKLLEDVVKVTVDWQRNPISATGDFELIHCCEIPKVESTKIDLSVKGTKLERFQPRTTMVSNQKSVKAKSFKEERRRASSYPPKYKSVRGTSTVTR